MRKKLKRGDPFQKFFLFHILVKKELDIIFERFRKIKYLANLEGVEK
jgi:hypothetical protein